MAYKQKLKIPVGLKVNFKPSEKQFVLWKALQPECHICGSEIVQELKGKDHLGNEIYAPTCSKCKNENIPQMILAGGSAGGGKSYLLCMWIATSAIRFNDTRYVLARKTLKILKETTLVTFFKVLKEIGLEENVNYSYDAINGTIKFWNDSIVILKELTASPTDPEWSSLGGLELTGVGIDECDTVPEKAVDILFSRIRHKTSSTFKVPKMLLTCNPNLAWPRPRFVIDQDGKDVVTAKGEFYIPFSLFDNPDKEFRDVYANSLRKLSPQEQNRLLYGDWRYVKSSDAACYKGFTSEKHLVDNLKETRYDPEKPYIISFDFNTFPYMSTLGIQIDYETKEVLVLEEFIGYAKDKRNNSPAQARYIDKQLKLARQEAKILITGDPSGTQKSTLVEEGVNNFTIIKDNITLGSPEVKILSKQPSQSTRVEWINSIFERNHGDWKILIDSKCFKFIEDLVYQLKNSDGTKNKDKIFDATVGVKYEKYGHLNDCFEMAMCYFLSDDYAKFKKKSKTAPIPYSSAVTPVWNY